MAPNSAQIQAAGALIGPLATTLAFIVAGYAVLLQMKKSQTTVDTIFKLIFLASLLLLLESGAQVRDSYIEASAREPFSLSKPLDLNAVLDFVEPVSVFLVTSWLVMSVLGDIIISSYFRTDLRIIPRRLWRKAFKPMRFEEKAPEPIDYVNFIRIFKSFFYLQDREPCYFLDRASELGRSVSVLATKSEIRLHNLEVAALTLDTLMRHELSFVEYVSCIRHPIEVFDDVVTAYMRRAAPSISEEGRLNPTARQKSREDAQRKLKESGILRRLFLVDAHTPHFGFDEEVYAKKTRLAEVVGAQIQRSKKSYPGVHTTHARSFHKMEKNSRKNGEVSTDDGHFGLVILDEPSALADVDSPSQFKLFIRHVVASERLMGGILTVIYEPRSTIKEMPFLPEIVDWHFDFHDRFDVAFPPWQIEEGVSRCAQALLKRIMDKKSNITPDNPLVLMSILDGGKAFADALFAEVKREWEKVESTDDIEKLVELRDVSARKYGAGTQTNRRVKISSPSSFANLNGRTVVLIDDICHTGDTINAIRQKLNWDGATVWTAVAIQRSNEAIDFYAVDFNETYPNLPDAWMYGFGMDDANNAASRAYSCFVFKRRVIGDAQRHN